MGSSGSEPEARVVPQLNDTVYLTLTLSEYTEEWADELLAQEFDVSRDDDGRLVVRHEVGGNCNALANARMWLAEVEDYLDEGDVDPMWLTLTATTESGNRTTPIPDSRSSACPPPESSQAAE